jgi:hypothetical protein
MHICFPFFWEIIQVLVTVKITENNLIFFSDFFTTQLINIEFETLIMLYSDSA